MTDDFTTYLVLVERGMMLVALFFFARGVRHQNECNRRVIKVLNHQLDINKAQILLNDDIEKRLDGKGFS